MKNTLFLIVMTLLACNKDDSSPSLSSGDIMQDCANQAFDRAEDIKNNLLGSWELIDYACGFCPPSHPVPVAHVRFDRDSAFLSWQSSPSDPVEHLSFTWEIETAIHSSGSYHLLKTEPEHMALRSRVFCLDYMFFDFTPSDGPRFVYEKE